MQIDLLRTDRSLEEFVGSLELCRDKASFTHALHPYPAKFIPEIPRFLIDKYSLPGDTVLDPMCGSGTTLVEAIAARRKAIGIDLNPIAALVSRVKTTPLSAPSMAEVRRWVRDLLKMSRDRRTIDAQDVRPPAFHNRDKWFEAPVVQELAIAKRLIEGSQDRDARLYGLCLLSSIIVRVSNQESETRWCAKPKTVVPGQTLETLAARMSKGLKGLSALSALHPARAMVINDDARNEVVEPESVDLIVTSPPYANSHDYYLYNKLRMFWLGYDVSPVQRAEIGSRHRHSDLKQELSVYVGEMTDVVTAMRRALKASGVAVIVVADALIRDTMYPMDEVYSDIAQRVGMSVRSVASYDHRQFNAVFQRGFGTRREKLTHLLVLQG